MGEYEKEELKRKIETMSEEELKVVVSAVPVEMCVKRIANEVNRLRGMQIAVKNIIEIAENG